MIWLCRRLEDFSQAQYDNAYAGLSLTRKSRIDRLRRPEDRHRSLAGEILAKELARQWGVPHPQLEALPSGQPVLTDCGLYLSIAHCDTHIVCAVSDQPVGIDIERLRPFRSGLLRHVCTPAEKAYVTAGAALSDTEITDPAIIDRFFEIWTAKEAWFKKAGTGITDLHSVQVLNLERQIHRLDGYLIQIV